MATIAFDTLKFARKLKDAGVPENQAVAQAEIMAEAFLLNMDALVTTDYLDARFAEQDARMDTRFVEQDARMDARLAELEARIDTRFAEQDARMDTRFVEHDARIDVRFTDLDARFARIDVRFAEMDGKFRLLTWMLAVVMASTVIPAIHKFMA